MPLTSLFPGTLTMGPRGMPAGCKRQEPFRKSPARVHAAQLALLSVLVVTLAQSEQQADLSPVNPCKIDSGMICALGKDSPMWLLPQFPFGGFGVGGVGGVGGEGGGVGILRTTLLTAFGSGFDPPLVLVLR